MTNLTYLDLSNVPRITSDTLVYMASHCVAITSLNLSLNSFVTDQCVDGLTKHLVRLSTLYLVSCPITDDGESDLPLVFV